MAFWLSSVAITQVLLAIFLDKELPIAFPFILAWWTIADSIPVIEATSILDWEKPLVEYSSTVGVILLATRVVFLLAAVYVVSREWEISIASRRTSGAGTG
jgi:hypothetical protein